MEIQKAIPLEINESDLSPDERQGLKEELLNTRTLGEREETNRKLLDILPAVIAKRVSQVIPNDFTLVELEIKFDVQGKLFGTGVGGEVVAKLQSSRMRTD